jgi:exodeoxyribonuclease VII small subunit
LGGFLVCLFVANYVFLQYCNFILKGQNMDSNKLSFEEAYKQLTELVQKMESGEMPLADSVAAYEKGIKLKAYCEQLLKEAELKIETLKVTNAGE